MEKIWREKIAIYNELRARADSVALLLNIGNESYDMDFAFSEDLVHVFWLDVIRGESISERATFPLEYLWLTNEEIHAKRI